MEVLPRLLAKTYIMCTCPSHYMYTVSGYLCLAVQSTKTEIIALTTSKEQLVTCGQGQATRSVASLTVTLSHSVSIKDQTFLQSDLA